MQGQRKSERTVRVPFSLLVPLYLGSSSRSIRALSRRAVCINSAAFMWTPSLSSSLHLTNGCGFHIDKHSYPLEYHSLCCCASYGLLFPGRLCLLLTGILHFSCSHKTLNRLIRSLCGALEMFLNYLLPLEAGVSFSTWSCY